MRSSVSRQKPKKRMLPEVLYVLQADAIAAGKLGTVIMRLVEG